MTGVDIFVLFVLPATILVGSLGGLWILNRPAPAKPEPDEVRATYDLAKIIHFPAVGE